MITAENIKSLSINNYVRKASHTSRYWLDLTRSTIDLYRSKFQDFNVVIYSELNSEEHYYVIPYFVLKDILQEKYYTHSKSEKRERWIGNIIDHKLKITHCPIQVDLKPYYSISINGLEQKFLQTIQGDIDTFSEEFESKFEGIKKSKLVNYYERNLRLRADAIKIHGTKCKVCQFDYNQVYGPHGENYIEVHHLKPVSSLTKSTLIDPKKDMIVLCANCHRMVHRKKDNPLSIGDLKKLLKANRKN